MCQCCMKCRSLDQGSITMVALRSTTSSLDSSATCLHHRKGLRPAVVTKCLQFLVHNVSGHDGVDNKLATLPPRWCKWRRVARQSYYPGSQHKSTEFWRHSCFCTLCKVEFSRLSWVLGTPVWSASWMSAEKTPANCVKGRT
jgi:hypothetical protein